MCGSKDKQRSWARSLRLPSSVPLAKVPFLFCLVPPRLFKSRHHSFCGTNSLIKHTLYTLPSFLYFPYNMEEACRNEIERLHEFFVQWFGGALPEDVFGEACQQVFGEDMQMITPSGRMLNRSQLIQQLLSGYACHKGKQFSIEIRNAKVILREGDWCLVTYEEWQLLEAETTSRRSTALFRSKQDAPSCVEWVHLQETWMDKQDGASSPKSEKSRDDSSVKSKDDSSVTSRPQLLRRTSLVSMRRHLSPQLPQFQATNIMKEGEVVGIELNGWKISSQQHSIGDDAWFCQATERLQESAQPPRPTIEHPGSTSVTYRHICLPEMVFPRAHITLEQVDGTKLKFGAYPALLEWAQAHQSIPLGSSKEYKGVSVMQVADAKLWSSKSKQDTTHSNFHYDWTFSTPHACTTTMDVSWTPLPKSGMDLSLLQDQTVPILLFDEVILYEDDLHDNGQVTLTCKIRVMPTCVYCLERLWVRVDGVLLRVRDTRVSLEFYTGKVYRDVAWRQCRWEDLGKHGLSTDLRSWCPETGGVSDEQWQTALLRIPAVPLPSDLPAHAVLNET